MKQYGRTLLAVGIILLRLFVGICMLIVVGFLLFVNRWSHRSSSPTWSPDGERIAFVCHRPTLSQVWEDKGASFSTWGYLADAFEICIIKPDGRGFIRLTKNQDADLDPAWSPDGQWIAYVSRRRLQFLKEDGSQSQSLQLDEGVFARELIWSPDGKRLGFTAGGNLYVATLEDGTIRALTTLPGDEFDAAWSPDSTRMSFTRDSSGVGKFYDHGDTIWIVDMEGRLESVDLMVPEFEDIGMPSWNPEGTQLAFWGYRRDDDDSTRGYNEVWLTEVYTVDLETGEVRCLTEGYELDFDYWAAWTPDGARIAFTADEALYTVLPDGTDLAQIALFDQPMDGYTLYNSGFTWAPGEKYLALLRFIEGDMSKNRIWVVEMEEGRMWELRVP